MSTGVSVVNPYVGGKKKICVRSCGGIFSPYMRPLLVVIEINTIQGVNPLRTLDANNSHIIQCAAQTESINYLFSVHQSGGQHMKSDLANQCKNVVSCIQKRLIKQ